MKSDQDKFEEKILVVCGATASGKTDFFNQKYFSNPNLYLCINADTGQMYREVSIGTTKPELDLLSQKRNFFLFDILNLGEAFSAGQYRKKVEALVLEAWNCKKIPVVVGGSMFYINALFFPPEDPILSLNDSIQSSKFFKLQSESTEQLYLELKNIDPERARAIMPNDRYRILRALEIWFLHKIRPSELEPKFTPIGKTEVFFVQRTQKDLDARILARLKFLLNPPDGKSWIDEAREIYKKPEIHAFIKSSRLIGYKEIFDWLDKGGKSSFLPDLEQRLYFATRNYAKKQLKFWRRLEEKIVAADKEEKVKIFRVE